KLSRKKTKFEHVLPAAKSPPPPHLQLATPGCITVQGEFSPFFFAGRSRFPLARRKAGSNPEAYLNT
ncbi:MAG: hypothetical protein ACOCVU_04225, partial [Desulfohalobiaceae bacterium]